MNNSKQILALSLLNCNSIFICIFVFKQPIIPIKITNFIYTLYSLSSPSQKKIQCNKISFLVFCFVCIYIQCTWVLHAWNRLVFFSTTMCVDCVFVKAALHSRENERNMRETRMWMRFSYSSQVLLLFSNCSPYFVGFLAREKGTRERENMREHVLTPHSHVSHYFFFFNIHIVIICESNTQKTCRSCHFSVHCHRTREL